MTFVPVTGIVVGGRKGIYLGMYNWKRGTSTVARRKILTQPSLEQCCRVRQNLQYRVDSQGHPRTLGNWPYVIGVIAPSYQDCMQYASSRRCSTIGIGKDDGQLEKPRLILPRTGGHAYRTHFNTTVHGTIPAHLLIFKLLLSHPLEAAQGGTPDVWCRSNVQRHVTDNWTGGVNDIQDDTWATWY